MLEQLSLGHTFLESNGVNGTPVNVLNYVNSDHSQFLPFPDGDRYLCATAVPAIREGEVVVTNKLVRGLLGYYESLGLIPVDSRIVEVDPMLGIPLRFGFPFTDSLSLIEDGYFSGNNGHFLSSTFYSESVRLQAERIGLSTPARPDSFITNNKARLRRFASAYGIEMLPGFLVESRQDLEDVESRFDSVDRGIWLKFPTGSGGDLVKYVHDLSRDGLTRGISTIRDCITRALTQAEFGIGINQFWPSHQVVPSGFPIVVESDVRNVGKVLVNGSTQFITRKDSTEIDLIGHFSQITRSNGEYLGNRPYYSSKLEKLLIQEQIERVARYNTTENGYFGIQGVDWFLIRDSLGQVRVTVTELNSRPTANTPPVIIADKLGARDWINTNVYTDRPIKNIDDFIRTVGADLALGYPDSGLVVPQAFRTLMSHNFIHPSGDFKVLIMSNSRSGSNEVMKRLVDRGVVFEP